MNAKTDRKLFLQLGRAGDVINVLPLALEHKSRTGEIPLFMVAKEFAHVLDGVSYVEPVVFDGPFEQVVVAAYNARKLTEDISFCQIYGRGVKATQACTSFAREAWEQGRSVRPWGTLPLVFDRRDPLREKALVDRVIGPKVDDRPIVLLALTGHSSPFPFRKLFGRYLETYYGDRFRFLDLGEVRAERFFDLLGIFELARLLITIDTGHLHLAAAVPELNVLTLITREPTTWHGSPWRSQHVGRIYYDEFHRILESSGFPLWNRLLLSPRRARFIHVWADWRKDLDPGTARRRKIARESWDLEAATAPWTEKEFRREDAKRDGRSIGDPDELHFIRDTVEHAIAGAERDAIVVLTNSDTCFAPGLSGRIADCVRRNGSGFAHRYDFERLEAPLVHEGRIRSSCFYPGTDLIFFTPEWWKRWGPLLGDYVAGREGWDEAFRQLVKFTGGRGIDHAIYHERHPTVWEKPEMRDVGGNVYNRRLREKWFNETGFVPEDFRYFHLVEKDHQ